MPEKKTAKKAKESLRRGKRPTTAAGEFVREEMEHVRRGKHGARSTKQAIAIGLSKARRAGVPLEPPPGVEGRPRALTPDATAMARRPRADSKTAGKGRATSARTSVRSRWSRRVTERSNALDLEKGVFSQRSPRQIALSLKRSAERSRRRKSDPFRSAMSMLTFYVNRAGKRLDPERKRLLSQAKDELRRVFRRKSK